jgi:hypothetical protein
MILVANGLLCLLAVPMMGLAEEGKLKISGDIRGRYEGFRFSEDETGAKKANRSRLRYRFRLNLKVNINEHMKAAARITTGDSDNRSGNQTLGRPVDFSPSEFDLRRAYIVYYPFKKGVLPGERKGAWEFQFGRTPNPFIWKYSVDKLLWDSDIALAGAGTLFDLMVTETLKLFANAGYYVVAESSSGKDPFMAPFQAGLAVTPSEKVSFGVRGTWYYFDKLNEAFIQRGVDGTGGVTSSKGNIVDGLTGDPEGGTLNVAEGGAFIALGGSEKWPVNLFGSASFNTSATESDSIPEAGKEEKGFLAGADVGSKKKAIRVGVAYAYIEANAFPSQFIDSDYLDGVTNRQGLIVWLQRQLLKNTDAGVTLFHSDAINHDLSSSVEDSERFRIQVDLVLKF